MNMTFMCAPHVQLNQGRCRQLYNSWLHIHRFHSIFTKASIRETLPTGYSRSYAGFLLRDGHFIIQVDQKVMKHEAEYLQNFATITCFIGGKPPEYQMQNWILLVHNAVDNLVTLGRNLGK